MSVYVLKQRSSKYFNQDPSEIRGRPYNYLRYCSTPGSIFYSEIHLTVTYSILALQTAAI